MYMITCNCRNAESLDVTLVIVVICHTSRNKELQELIGIDVFMERYDTLPS